MLGLIKHALDRDATFSAYGLQSSALRSQSQRAIWQAVHSHLMLLQSLDLLDLQPETVSKLIVAACADAAAAASDVLLPLLASLRFACHTSCTPCWCLRVQSSAIWDTSHAHTGVSLRRRDLVQHGSSTQAMH